jgi:hypothetical protein
MTAPKSAKMKPTKAWALVANHDGMLNGVYCHRSEAMRVRRALGYTRIMHIERVLVTGVSPCPAA